MEDYLIAAIILVLVGLCFLSAEFFVPTGGILIVCGVVLFAIAIAIIMYAGTRTEAVVSVLALCIGLPALGAAMFQTWKRFALTRGLDPDAAGGSITTAVPELASLDKLVGRFGKTVTTMRPSGAVELDGRRVDALTEGVMLEANVRVRCVGVRAGHVIVRKAEAPRDLAEMNFEGLE